MDGNDVSDDKEKEREKGKYKVHTQVCKTSNDADGFTLHCWLGVVSVHDPQEKLQDIFFISHHFLFVFIAEV